MTGLAGWLTLSLALAALAFGLPWLTHFADGGLSILLPVLWLASVVAAIARLGWRGLWLLAGTPLILFWPVTIAMWASDPHLGF